jgi:hypothetical protein
MAKVILINSREIGKILASSLWSNADQIEIDKFLDILLCYKKHSLFHNAISNLSDDKLDKTVSEKLDKLPTITELYSDIRINEAFNDNWFASLDKTTKKSIVSESKSFFANLDSIYGDTNHWDAIYYVKKDDNYIFLAHEYYKNTCSPELCSAYYNAIVNDIIDHLETNAGTYNWLFISHDADWCYQKMAGKSEKSISKHEIHEDYKKDKLGEVLKKGEVIVFQHTGTLYKKVIQNFCDNIQNLLCNENLSAHNILDSLSHSVEVEKENGKEKLYCAYCEDAGQCKDNNTNAPVYKQISFTS